MEDSSLDRRLRALADFRRRAVCRYFAGTGGGTADCSELADFVARQEQERTESGPDDYREAVEVDLVHVQLPILQRAGVLEFDPRSGTVNYLGDRLVEELLGELNDCDAVAP